MDRPNTAPDEPEPGPRTPRSEDGTTAPPADDRPPAAGFALPDGTVSRAGRVPGWRTLVPLGIIILAGLALLVVNALVQIRIQRYRAEAETLSSDVRLVTSEITSALALEMSTARAYALTGDSAYLAAYVETRRRELEAYPRLETLASRVEPRLLPAIRELRARSDAWHAQLEDQRFPGMPRPLEIYASAIPEDERLFEEAVAAAASLQQAISRALTEIRLASGRIQRIAYYLGLILVLLMIGATLITVQLARILSRTAREEASLRHIARTLAAGRGVGDVIQRIADSPIAIGRADGAYVERIVGRFRDAEIVAVSGVGTPPVGTRAPYPGSLTEEAAEAGEPVYVTDPSADDRPMAEHLSRACKGCSLLILPLVSGGELLGSLVLVRRPEKRPFGEGDVPYARAHADLAALALRRVLSLAEAQSRRAESEAILSGKSRLIRGISHDLKNPLGAVDGYAQLLLSGARGELQEGQKEWIERIRKSINSAMTIINDLLELSRAETGALPIEPASTRIDDLVRELAEENAAAAATAGVRLDVDVPADLPVIETDPRQVRRVLGNLLSNGIKYTPEGGLVRITVSVREDDRRAPGPGRWLAIDVSDNGPGIPEDEQEKIFEEFHRVEQRDTVERGAGLGLAIGRHIARLLGGDLNVRSQPGAGATFTLWLPLRRPAAAHQRPAA